jgi:cysteine desulfurase / selenocysteine lyase
MIDIEFARADTPACERIIHFNNAGASLMPDPVFTAISEHLELEREHGGYEAENLAGDKFASFYTEFAALLNCEPNEIAYVENATRAWDMAFYGLPLEKGDRILTHGSEYSSNFLALLQQSRRRGYEIDLVPSDESGQIDVSALEAMIGPRTRLIALTHVPTQGGLVNPAASVGQVANKHDLIYMLDACQSVGQIDIDVQKIGCHVLSGTGRKFLRGPRGTGFLYVASDMIEQIEPPFIDMRAANWIDTDAYEYASGAKRFETWESYVAGRLGLARAVRYARDIGVDQIEERVSELAATLRETLSSLPDVSVHDLGTKKCAIVTFQKQGETPTDIVSRLRQRGINVSVIDALSAQLDFSERGLDQLVRASVHYFNTEDEIGRFAEAVC